MTDYNELVKSLQSIFDEVAAKIKPIKGFLGDGQGNVAVPNRPDYSYARFDQGSTTYFELFNKNAPTINNWPVLIGEIPWQPGLTQVISTDWDAYIGGGWGEGISGLGLHAPTHEWGDQQRGVDALSVYTRSIAPFRTYAVENELTTVYANAMEYYTGSVWGGTPGVDLSPIIGTLSTGTALFAGVYLDTDNTLSVVTGTTSVDTPAFDPPRVVFPWGTIPTARVRLYGGQTQILESDIRDARRLWDFPATGTAAGGGTPSGAAGGDLAGTYPNPTVDGLYNNPVASTSPSEGNFLMYSGSAWRPVDYSDGYPFDVLTVDATDADADHATIGAAITAASAGDVILIGPATYTEQLTVSTQVTLRGVSQDDCIITNGSTPTVTISTPGVIIENLTINNTTASGHCIDTSTTSDTFTVRDCTLNKTGATSNIGIETDADAVIENCTITTANGTSTSAGIYINNTTAAVTVRGGEINTGTGSIVQSEIYLANSGVTAKGRELPTLINGRGIKGAGVAGWAGAHFYNGDILIKNDEAGVWQRTNTLMRTTVEDDFIGSAFGTAWTFAGSPFVTPAGQSFTTNSTVLIGHNATNARIFLSRTDNLTNTNHYLTAAPNILVDDAYFGFRFDDGTDDNYVESCIRKTNSVDTLELISRTRSGGGSVTVTVRKTIYDFPAWMSVGMTIGGTQWSSWSAAARFSKSGPGTFGITMASGLTWTPSRRGIVIFNASTTTTSSGPYIDKVQTQ